MSRLCWNNDAICNSLYCVHEHLYTCTMYNMYNVHCTSIIFASFALLCNSAGSECQWGLWWQSKTHITFKLCNLSPLLSIKSPYFIFLLICFFNRVTYFPDCPSCIVVVDTSRDTLAPLGKPFSSPLTHASSPTVKVFPTKLSASGTEVCVNTFFVLVLSLWTHHVGQLSRILHTPPSR